MALVSLTFQPPADVLADRQHFSTYWPSELTLALSLVIDISTARLSPSTFRHKPDIVSRWILMCPQLLSGKLSGSLLDYVNPPQCPSKKRMHSKQLKPLSKYMSFLTVIRVFQC